MAQAKPVTTFLTEIPELGMGTRHVSHHNPTRKRLFSNRLFNNCDGKIVLLTVFTGLFTTLLNPSREPGAEHYFSDNFS